MNNTYFPWFYIREGKLPSQGKNIKDFVFYLPVAVASESVENFKIEENAPVIEKRNKLEAVHKCDISLVVCLGLFENY